MKKKLGLIINPIAGMGGRVGLKGTDGMEIVRRARELEARPEAPARARLALNKLSALRDQIDLLTYPGDMGEREALECGFKPVRVGSLQSEESSQEDTRRAARALADRGVDLILFAGGDGTARDLFTTVGEDVTVLGIPAGVKIHSAVYATSPGSAGDLARLYLSDQVRGTRLAEVMDIDEEAFRSGRVSAELFGYLRIPNEPRLVQAMKVGRSSNEEASVQEIAQYVIDEMQDGLYYIVGPGTTTKAITQRLGIQTNLLGVDVLLNRELAWQDANEAQLLEVISGRPAQILITIIGGQGYLFGRGNQQISSRVIRRVGKENVHVIATENKVLSVHGRSLLVDTGDEETDRLFKGYIRVTIGYRKSTMVRIGLFTSEEVFF